VADDRSNAGNPSQVPQPLDRCDTLQFVACFTRYNLSQVEQWLREQRLHDGGALEVMWPMIEATQLLQARKTDADVTSICDMCAHLSTSQVLVLLAVVMVMFMF